MNPQSSRLAIQASKGVSEPSMSQPALSTPFGRAIDGTPVGCHGSSQESHRQVTRLGRSPVIGRVVSAPAEAEFAAADGQL